MKNILNRNKNEILIFLGLYVFALIIRLFALKNFGDFWVDEFFSAYFATKPTAWAVTKALVLEDLHAPLYFVLLHFWINIFGASSAILMRLMGLIISTLTVPIAYLVIKDLFKNRISAIFCALFLAMSAFNIHYSVELRFYGMSILFALLATYYFVKYIQTFQKWDIIFYIISALFLLYTFNFSFMYIFCQFLVGVVYFVANNKKGIIRFLLPYFVIFIFYLPFLIVIMHNVFVYQTAILKFVRDIYYFDITWFLTYFITVFSNLFQQFVMNEPLLNINYIENFFYWKMFLFVFLPMFLGIFGMVLGLKNLTFKNEKMFLFFIPALLLFFIQVVFVLNHYMALIYRYTIITTTLLLILSVLGLITVKKSNKICFSIVIIWFLLNFSSYFVLTKSHPVLNRQIEYTINLKECADKLDIKSTDIVLIPSNGKLFKQNIKNGQFFDIGLYDSFYLGIRPNDIKFVFGEDLASKLNRKNAKTLLYPYIVFNEPLLELKKNMEKEIFSKMKSGQRFILISDEEIKDLKVNQAFLQQGIGYYQRSAIGNTLFAKIITDMIEFSKQKLTFKEYIEPSGMFFIYEFEKE